ncbi:tRNA (N6-threonylcarbamoyladenosine(37)-N6)-methyltransferase TrmO [Neptunomonas marina]|uniref:tRNA (N6-threonylcarbamoyladenosine(37)-N6)-methyltransferase TrmO n=1 Tax=Neptunomonas marina TaxID=1815562 RepID=A0A437Q7B3_9GAMM|nr:tRNA (N6-threonylcarbamoyladenosine(37)-N6)-methyltransferase TrmO [Neptunomonas marina]RVU30366.1 tRNA (N6-threonylcarbamoyladenosine(37)-N6)-methyltransferase TrmO [Neptunomonas marina]
MQISPIATIQSPFKEKFGIPRQPGLATSVTATVELLPPFNTPEAVKGLENYSHIWLLFIFSECVDKGWKASVRPPRLGGNEKMGVFATRSPFRPNNIGMSVVRLDQINTHAGTVSLTVSGADLLDGTPIVDIKPYVPYSDAITDANTTVATPVQLLELPVVFSAQAQAVLDKHDATLQRTLCEVLRCDPRPAYQRDPKREYGLRYDHYNIRWSIREDCIEVLAIDSM